MPRFLEHAGRRRRGPRQRFARQLASVAASALAVGAALEYFLDPRSGRRRRHVVGDRTRGALRRRARTLERQTRYEKGKLVGLTHRMRHREQAAPDLDDVSLVHRVESELFRDRTIPKSRISLNADNGVVVLRGGLDRHDEIARVERAVRKVSGVRDVENLLHLPGQPPPASRPHGDPRASRTPAA